MPKQSIPSSVLSLFVAQRVFQVCTAALVSNSCAVFLRTIIIAALSLALVGMEVAASAAAPSTCLMGGDLDPTFDGDGKVMTDFSSGFDVAYAVAVQSDGKIVAAGVIGNTQDFAIARYNADGSLDPGFSSDGMTTTDFAGGNDQARSVAIQSDGKIVVAGYAAVGSATDFALARYNGDGSLDPGFAGGKVTTDFGSTFNQAFAVAVQADGKIVASGLALIGGVDVFAVARYNADGSLDTSFSSDGKVTTAFGVSFDQSLAQAIALQPDTKIIAVGYAILSGAGNFALARYNSDGSLDTSFDGDGKVTTLIGTGAHAYACALQPDGKLVAGGFANIGSGHPFDFALARYNTDGSLDSTFDVDGKVTTIVGSAQNSIYGIALEPDGKIVAAGNAKLSTFDFALARYNADGSLDTTFDTDGLVITDFSSNLDQALAVVVQTDGKIVAAGSASLPTGGSDFALARYGACPPDFQLTAAASRKVHGGQRSFDITLPLAGEPGVECRSSNGRHQLVLTFNADVVSGNANVTEGTGTVSGNPAFSGNTMTVNLRGVTDVQKITVTLSDVTSSTSEVLPDTPVSINMLIGDTDADKTVSRLDVNLTRDQLGMQVTDSNFREDVKVTGLIDPTDVRIVRSDLGHSLP